MKGYTPTIGMEIHAELKTKTKMFCGSMNDPHHGEPNMHTCPVCLAHPGTLPTINTQAVEHVLKVGLALGGSLATFTEFDRKNYFYPDIPKGYQISQYDYPLVRGGELAGVEITRVHLEEDTARSVHDKGSIVDYNRAGVPLMELVTEPVIHDAESAGAFARELQLLLRLLEVSDANMELGEMRVEANISVSKDAVLGTKVEVKNLNSFKSVTAAIEYEVKRQVEALEKGEIIAQETRGWDENKGRTFMQRIKETSEDYRYFPDPDLPKLNISEIFDVSRIKEKLPKLAPERRDEYINLGLTREQADIILLDTKLRMAFDRACALDVTDEVKKLAANYLTSDVQALLAEKGDDAELHFEAFGELMEMLVAKEITSRVAKDLLPEVVFEGESPRAVAEERGLIQKNNEEDLFPIIDEILAENQSVVEEYRSGKEASLKFLVGQGMKKTQGSANPELLKELLQRRIST